jgi:hypothetical protein
MRKYNGSNKVPNLLASEHVLELQNNKHNSQRISGGGTPSFSKNSKLANPLKWVLCIAAGLIAFLMTQAYYSMSTEAEESKMGK